jgi:hypothetical protein
MTGAGRRRTVDLRTPAHLLGSEGGTPVTQTLHAPIPVAGGGDTRTTRLGAAAGLAAIVLIATGFALLAAADATFHSSDTAVVAYFTQADVARTVAGGFLQILGLLLLLPFVAMLTSRVRGPGASGDLLAPTARSAATIYVALSLAPGMSAGAAALWHAHARTADVAILTALNDLRALSYFVALLPFALFLVAIGLAGNATRQLPGWAGWSAIVLGAVLAAGVPAAGTGLTDIVALLGLLWVPVVAVHLLRHPVPASDGRSSAIA